METVKVLLCSKMEETDVELFSEVWDGKVRERDGLWRRWSQGHDLVADGQLW